MRSVRRVIVGGRVIVPPTSGKSLQERLRTDPKLRSAFRPRPSSLESLIDRALLRIAASKVRTIGLAPRAESSFEVTAAAVSRAAAWQLRVAPVIRLAVRVDGFVTEQLIVPAGRVFMSSDQLLRSCGYRAR